MPQTFKHTPRFLTPLQFQDNGGFPFVLTSALGYVTAIQNRGTFFVPTGFKTDLASVPRFLWAILPPMGKYDAAAVLHDFFYQDPRGLMRHGVMPSRSEADAVLNEAMEVLGVPWDQRQLIYWGVRLGGWVVWRKYRNREQKKVPDVGKEG